MKAIQGVYSGSHPHWVGDGFPVRTVFSYSPHGRHLSPFLLLDYAGPHSFSPTDANVVSVGIHIEALRRSPSCTKVKLLIVIQQVLVEPLVQGMCSG